MIDVKFKDENMQLIKMAQDGDMSAMEALIKRNTPLIYKAAHCYMGRGGTDFEDLVQIGSIGMLKAVRTFDFERGCAFSTYAVPLIIGEIRRYLRDDGQMKISRTYKHNSAVIIAEREKFSKEHGREPSISELSEICGMSVETINESLDATAPVHSLSDLIAGDDMTVEDTVPSDFSFDEKIEGIALRESLSSLPPLWRQIITLRYYKDYSQDQTARTLGLSQVKISREEKKIFEKLRRDLACY